MMEQEFSRKSNKFSRLDKKGKAHDPKNINKILRRDIAKTISSLRKTNRSYKTFETCDVLLDVYYNSMFHTDKYAICDDYFCILKNNDDI